MPICHHGCLLSNKHVHKCLQGIDDATHRGCITKSVFISLASSPNKELYCSKIFCIAIEQGTLEYIFDEATDLADVGSKKGQEGVKIGGAVFCARNRCKDIDFVWNEGLVVNDDNEPAPKNVSQEQVHLMGKVGVLMEKVFQNVEII